MLASGPEVLGAIKPPAATFNRATGRLLLSAFLSIVCTSLLVLAIGVWTRGSPIYLGPNGGFFVLFPLYPAATALAIAAFVVAAETVSRNGTARLLGVLGVALIAGFVAAILPVAAAQAAEEISSVYWYGRYLMFLPGSLLAGVHILLSAITTKRAERGRTTTLASLIGLVGSLGAPFMAFALFSYRIPGIREVALGLAGLVVGADVALSLATVRAGGAAAIRA